MAPPRDQPRRRRRAARPLTHSISSLTPEQVGRLLAAAQQDQRPWLRAFVVLAAATGARTGELCGLEWRDLDLDAGTIRFRQALSSVDQQLATGQSRPGAGVASYWWSAP